MKIRIELDENQAEEEVVIRCSSLNEQVVAIQNALRDAVGATQKLPASRGTTEYYLPIDSILFFETDESGVLVHTRKELYQTRYRLYELENLLPGFFMRVSKSAILNTKLVYSIDRNLTASSIVSFQGTHKQVYVSRYYYKPLISKLAEKRLYHER